jgi:L-serine dehydratase
MALSIFEVIGPPMIGPSSSHTAGACRIGWAARSLLGEAPQSVMFRLHGSFAATGTGHGTPEALIAGILGMAPDDERLKNAPGMAPDAGLEVSFAEIDLGPQAHPNSVRVEARGASRTIDLEAASVGGGSIVVTEIDGLPADIRGVLETLVLWHCDTPGFLAGITAVLACLEINVASIRTGRHHRGQEALTAVEVDGSLPGEVLALFSKTTAISRLAVLPILPGS